MAERKLKSTGYGDVAVEAAKLHSGYHTPIGAWEKAVFDAFPEQKSSREKGCPRGAFLGLCEDGYVKGIPPGSYTTSRWNKKYAIAGAEIVLGEPGRAYVIQELWKAVMKAVTNGADKAHNGQMDVVVGLLKANLLSLPESVRLT